MSPLHTLTPTEHARLYTLARQAAHEARERAMADAWRALGRLWGAGRRSADAPPRAPLKDAWS